MRHAFVFFVKTFVVKNKCRVSLINLQSKLKIY